MCLTTAFETENELGQILLAAIRLEPFGKECVVGPAIRPEGFHLRDAWRLQKLGHKSLKSIDLKSTDAV